METRVITSVNAQSNIVISHFLRIPFVSNLETAKVPLLISPLQSQPLSGQKTCIGLRLCT